MFPFFKKDLNSKDSVFHNFVPRSGSFGLVRLWVCTWCLRCSRSGEETVGLRIGSTTAKGKWSQIRFWHLLKVMAGRGGGPVFKSIYGRGGRSWNCARDWGKSSSRHVSPKELSFGWENWTRRQMGIGIRSWAQRWWRGTGASYVNKGGKDRKPPKELKGDEESMEKTLKWKYRNCLSWSHKKQGYDLEWVKLPGMKQSEEWECRK